MQAIFKVIGSKVQEHFAETFTDIPESKQTFQTGFEKISWDRRGVHIMSGDAISAEI